MTSPAKSTVKQTKSQNMKSKQIIILRGGAAVYLRKPVNDHLLLDAISTAMAQSAANPPPYL